ncbi:hypothetical protein [Serratia fonticola]|uniref:hypothetical protein n=1 Tax=Serratia fonticola TaxID=47917 RepID=UPI003AB0AF35
MALATLYKGVTFTKTIGRIPVFPYSLFDTYNGALFDISDITTLFQDLSGLVPVSASGQTVALVKDKSGLGHHLTQSDAAKRPVYNSAGYLVFDGTRGLDFTGSALSIFSNISYALACIPTSITASNYKTLFRFATPGEAQAFFRFGTGATANIMNLYAAQENATTTGTLPSITITAGNHLLTGIAKYVAGTSSTRKDGVDVGAGTLTATTKTNPAPAPTANVGYHTGANNITMNWYGAMFLGGDTDPTAQVSAIESYMAAIGGIAL